ncbi:MAG: family 20 glycosylhydrolase [Longimicrobiales bacterium]|nr:family 20 glycosylhydrolase [Longimicrobiales bacterium]
MSERTDRRCMRSALAALALVTAGCAGAPVAPPPLIPAPRSVEARSGGFTIDRSTRIAVADTTDAELVRLAEAWAAPIRRATGLPLPVGGAGRVRLAVEDAGEPESYRLRVDDEGVRLTGADPAGLFHGLTTLTQLLPPGLEGRASATGASDPSPDAPSSVADLPLRIAAVAIDDAPRFAWRGMHLDVGRHFFGPDFVKRYIDLLARYKINHFHWHLTEDQGWRIEIERYPKLTEVGAWRGDGERYGGFYTKEEIREIVAYAAERYVTIVPEIEMPGHSLAALAAYPELACTEGPFEVGTTWGVFEEIYCPTEETFAFLEGVLTEVIELFPGPFIHIGGDEAPRIRWEESAEAQAVIRREGLADEAELQGWFIRRIERFLSAHGRRLIGWDEIVEGGLPPGATVMSWRGTAGGVEAARAGHDVVMTPTSHMYFDYYQGDPEREPLAFGGYLPLEQVYAFEPVPAELSADEARHILGVQANVWTEYMKTPDHVEYMVFPRLFALAEVAWSEPAARSFASFFNRMGWHMERLDALGVRYRIPEVRGLEDDRLSLEERVRVELAAPLGRIRYTVSAEGAPAYGDGAAEPDGTAPIYTDPLTLDLGDGPLTVAARIELPDGRLGPVRSARFERTHLQAPVEVDATALESGFEVETLRGSFASVREMTAAAVARADRIDAVRIPGWAPEEHFGLRFRGYLHVPADGVYTFRVTSDDGSVLRVDGAVVVDHDGPHGPSARTGQVALAGGHHTIAVDFFQAGGGRALEVEWRGEGGRFEAVEGRAAPERVRRGR